MAADPRSTHAYLTIVFWPEHSSKEQQIEMAAQALGEEIASIRFRLRRPPPMIYGLIPIDAARAAARLIEESGGAAFVATLADIEALGGTLKVRDLRITDGRLEADIWRGPTAQVRFDEIQLLVRGSVSPATGGRSRGRSASEVEQLDDYMYGYTRPGVKWALSGGPMGTEQAHSERPMRLSSEKLDMHTKNGLVLQIDGDKFGFRALGEMRGGGDAVNMNKLTQLLTHLAPEAIVDTFFARWKPPTRFDRIRLLGMRINKEDPAFAFYSRWAALLYRHLS